MLEYFLVLSLALINRLLVVRTATPGQDVFGHLYFAYELKKQSIGPYGGIETKAVGSDILRLPFLWHWIIGKIFDISKLVLYQKWINPIIDSIFVIFIYHVSLLIGLYQFDALLLVLLYLFTPMLFSRLSIGPRIKSFTPRLLSEIATNILLIITLLPIELSNSYKLLVATVLVCYILLSSKFGTQVLFFLLPVIVIITENIILLFSFLLGIILSIIFSKGAFLLSLKEQYLHLKWYYRKNRNKQMPISERNCIIKFIIKIKSYSIKSKILNLVKYLIKTNSYTSVLFKMPVIIVCLIYLLIYFQFEENMSYTAPIIAAVIVFILVNRPSLLFLGEAERYLNHVIFFLIFWVTFISSKYDFYFPIYFVIAYGFVFWIFESFLLQYFDKKIDRFEEESKIIKYLEQFDSPKTIISYPYGAVGVYRIMLETIHKTCGLQIASSNFRNEFESKYATKFPFFRLEKLESMYEDYGVNVLIVDSKNLSKSDYGNWIPTKYWVKAKLDSNRFLVYIRNIQTVEK